MSMMNQQHSSLVIQRLQAAEKKSRKSKNSRAPRSSSRPTSIDVGTGISENDQKNILNLCTTPSDKYVKIEEFNGDSAKLLNKMSISPKAQHIRNSMDTIGIGRLRNKMKI